MHFRDHVSVLRKLIISYILKSVFGHIKGSFSKKKVSEKEVILRTVNDDGYL